MSTYTAQELDTAFSQAREADPKAFHEPCGVILKGDHPDVVAIAAFTDYFGRDDDQELIQIQRGYFRWNVANPDYDDGVSHYLAHAKSWPAPGVFFATIATLGSFD